MHEHKIIPGDPDQPHYPQAEAHTWNAFAGLAIELGGYGDLEVVDPYTGNRLWIPNAFSGDSDNEMANALRKLADLIEAGVALAAEVVASAEEQAEDAIDGPLHLVTAKADALFRRLAPDTEVVHHDPDRTIWGLSVGGVPISAEINRTP